MFHFNPFKKCKIQNTGKTNCMDQNVLLYNVYSSSECSKKKKKKRVFLEILEVDFTW